MISLVFAWSVFRIRHPISIGICRLKIIYVLANGNRPIYLYFSQWIENWDSKWSLFVWGIYYNVANRLGVEMHDVQLVGWRAFCFCFGDFRYFRDWVLNPDRYGSSIHIGSCRPSWRQVCPRHRELPLTQLDLSNWKVYANFGSARNGTTSRWNNLIHHGKIFYFRVWCIGRTETIFMLLSISVSIWFIHCWVACSTRPATPVIHGDWTGIVLYDR